MEGIDHLSRLGQDDGIGRGVSGRTSRAPKRIRSFQLTLLSIQPPTSIRVRLAGQDVDDLVVRHVGDGRPVVGMVVL